MLLWILGCLYPFTLVFSFSNIYPGVGWLDCIVGLFLFFWVSSILFSTVAAPIYIPTSGVQVFVFLYIFTNSCGLFDNSHSDRCEVRVLLLLFFLKKFWPCRLACWILVPQPGIKFTPCAVKAWSLNHWTTRKVPCFIFLKSVTCSACLAMLLWILWEQEHFYTRAFQNVMN